MSKRKIELYYIGKDLMTIDCNFFVSDQFVSNIEATVETLVKCDLANKRPHTIKIKIEMEELDYE